MSEDEKTRIDAHAEKEKPVLKGDKKTRTEHFLHDRQKSTSFKFQIVSDVSHDYVLKKKNRRIQRRPTSSCTNHNEQTKHKHRHIRRLCYFVSLSRSFVLYFYANRNAQTGNVDHPLKFILLQKKNGIEEL